MWSHDIVPVLLLGTSSEKALDCIDTDERQLAQTAVDYLLHLGHQHIAYCGMEPQRRRSQEMRQVFHLRGLSTESFIETGDLVAPSPEMAEQYLD